MTESFKSFPYTIYPYTIYSEDKRGKNSYTYILQYHVKTTLRLTR